jgi:hypothetical protein
MRPSHFLRIIDHALMLNRFNPNCDLQSFAGVIVGAFLNDLVGEGFVWQVASKRCGLLIFCESSIMRCPHAENRFNPNCDL